MEFLMNKTTKNSPDLSTYLDLAADTAYNAASSIFLKVDQEIMTNFRRDVKIKADIKLNEIIVNRLKKGAPYPVISEEGGFGGESTIDKSYRWIVDPLDGSLNFSRSIPICCISISFWKEMSPLLGVIYDFNRDEMFTGRVGKGAMLNNKPIKVGKVKEKKNAVLCTGFPVGTDFSESALLKFVKDIQSYKKVRLLGSAALSLAYTASGRADLYHENNIAIWDVAAGLAIVVSAGGTILCEPTKIKNRFNVKAANTILI